MRVTGRSWQEELYKIPDRVIAPAHIKGMHNYLTTWEKSVDVTDEFWGAQALERLSWFAPPKTVTRGGLALPTVALPKSGGPSPLSSLMREATTTLT